MQFVTPIYHPNIDSGGRICLDTLNMPPKGCWKPSLNVSTLLSTIRLLLSEPNPDDGLDENRLQLAMNDCPRPRLPAQQNLAATWSIQPNDARHRATMR